MANELPVHGYNECLIFMCLAHRLQLTEFPAEVYQQGWAQNGEISKTTFYKKMIRCIYVTRAIHRTASLFWAHYSYLGLTRMV